MLEINFPFVPHTFSQYDYMSSNFNTLVAFCLFYFQRGYHRTLTTIFCLRHMVNN